MNQLLIGNMLDSFSLVEASITTFSHFTIDGRLQKDFFDTDTVALLNESDSTYCKWKELKPYCFSLIRGKLPPLNFKMTFQLSTKQFLSLFPDYAQTLSSTEINGLNLSIQFKNKTLICTTGISFATFSLDKRPADIWDEALTHYLKSLHFDFDKL